MKYNGMLTRMIHYMICVTKLTKYVSHTTSAINIHTVIISKYNNIYNKITLNNLHYCPDG